MVYKFIKRLFDIIISILGLIITSPILIITAIAIKLESPGPVIFKQERLGLHGRVFKIYKFRSMCEGAEKKGTGQYSFVGDPRVTRVGSFIRKTSIDELPQFLNILRGDMSLIGPRPTLIYHPWKLDEYTEIQKKRFNIRPGVTGWAQINGRKDVPWDQRIEYDIEYVNDISLIFDMKIFFRTIFKVLSNKDNVNTKETAQKKSKSYNN